MHDSAGTPRVSVVIPHYGAPEPSRRLIADLLAQRPHQLIVCDDASPEPFPEVPGVTLVRREANGGFGAAVNSGTCVADGDLLLILNSDLQVPTDFISELVAAGARWQPVVVSPRVVTPAGVLVETARRFPQIRHQVAEWLTPLARWRSTNWWHRAVGHEVVAETDQPVDWLVGAALLMPLSEFRAVGGFDERFHMNREEIDLQMRLRTRGIGAVALSHPVVVHEGGGSSDPVRRRTWLVSSRLQYAAKWGGRRRLQIALVSASLVNLMVNLVRRACGRDVHPWQRVSYELRLLFPSRQGSQ